MPSQKNIKQLEDLKQKLGKAKSIVLADYQGLKVKEITQLRQKIKESGGELKIIKNTLLKLGLENCQYPLGDNLPIEGPTSVIFSYEDEVSALKALYDFCKENELPKIKAGFLGKNFLKADEVLDLAQLPSLEQLQGKLVMTLNSSFYRLTYILKANLIKLTAILKNIKSNN